MDFGEMLKEVNDGLSAEDQTRLRNEMTDFYRLKDALDKAEESKDILPYLVTELNGGQRNSFISRILGRYSKMFIQEIKQNVYKGAYTWVKQKEK